METTTNMKEVELHLKQNISAISPNSEYTITNSLASSEEPTYNQSSATESNSEPSTTWKDLALYILQTYCCGNGEKGSISTQITLWVAIAALGFAAYQVYLQNTSNTFAAKSYALGIWKDCRDRMVRLSLCLAPHKTD
jgi:hypothetical protein